MPKKHWIETEGNHGELHSLIGELAMELDSKETIIHFDNEGEPDCVKCILTEDKEFGGTYIELYEVEGESL